MHVVVGYFCQSVSKLWSWVCWSLKAHTGEVSNIDSDCSSKRGTYWFFWGCLLDCLTLWQFILKNEAFFLQNFLSFGSALFCPGFSSIIHKRFPFLADVYQRQLLLYCQNHLTKRSCCHRRMLRMSFVKCSLEQRNAWITTMRYRLHNFFFVWNCSNYCSWDELILFVIHWSYQSPSI